MCGKFNFDPNVEVNAEQGDISAVLISNLVWLGRAKISFNVNGLHRFANPAAPD